MRTLDVESGLTQRRLKEVLSYDPASGHFSWTGAQPGTRAGKRAGCVRACMGKRYWGIRVDRRLYFAHRLAYLYVKGCWPVATVDHRNGDGMDNSWENLRPATQSENLRNARSRQADRPFGGYYFDKGEKRWRAAMRIDGRQKTIGLFDTAEEAASAYVETSLEVFGEFSPFAPGGAQAEWGDQWRKWKSGQSAANQAETLSAQ